MKRLAGAGADAAAADADESLMVGPLAEVDELAALTPLQDTGPTVRDSPKEGFFRRVWRFNLIALAASLSWRAVAYVSFLLTNRSYGKADNAEFYAFLLLGQLVVYVADAAWTVIFAHVARLWESGRKGMAVFNLETAYKAVAAAVMTVTIVVYATSPLWVKILPAEYRAGVALLGGLLMFFQTIVHLAIMQIMAKLRERPVIISLAAAAGGAANVILALLWMPRYGPVGAAWAAGVGVYLGAGAVTAVYFLAAHIRLHGSTWFFLAAPALLLLLLLPWWWPAAAAWACVLGVAVLTPWLFSRRQKMMVLYALGNFAAMAKVILPWR